jgi:antitoxin component YwqK of YwqJK toxin-antitoxin module
VLFRSQKTTFSKGIPNSPSISYYESGTLQQQEFYSKKGGKIKQENYYPSGQLASSIPFLNDLEEGEAILYYETGKTQEIRRFSKGRLNGAREFYNVNGILERTETYELGNKINK